MPLSKYARDATPVRIYKAGSTPAYSNYATALAGYIVEHVSGESFDDYVEKHLFAVLGMQHASFRQPLPANLQPLMSSGYNLASDPSKPYEIVVPAPARVFLSRATRSATLSASWPARWVRRRRSTNLAISSCRCRR